MTRAGAAAALVLALTSLGCGSAQVHEAARPPPPPPAPREQEAAPPPSGDPAVDATLGLFGGLLTITSGLSDYRWLPAHSGIPGPAFGEP